MVAAAWDLGAVEGCQVLDDVVHVGVPPVWVVTVTVVTWTVCPRSWAWSAALSGWVELVGHFRPQVRQWARWVVCSVMVGGFGSVCRLVGCCR